MHEVSSKKAAHCAAFLFAALDKHAILCYDACRGVRIRAYKLMHSSTGYGLTTSNPCMSVTQRAAGDGTAALFLCPARFPSARAASTPPAGTLPQQRNTPADWQGCTSAICAEGARRPPPGGAWQPRTVRLAATPGRGAGARERQRREGAARPAASVSLASARRRERRRPLCLIGSFSRPRENEPWQRSCWPPATPPLCTFLPYRYLI